MNIDKKEFLKEIKICKKKLNSTNYGELNLEIQKLKAKLRRAPMVKKDLIRAEILAVKNKMDFLVSSSVSKKMSEIFEEMIIGISKNNDWFNTHQFNMDDCMQVARLDVYYKWHKFNDEEYNDPFAYFTTTIKNAMLRGLDIVKPQRDICNLSLSKEDCSILDIHQ